MSEILLSLRGREGQWRKWWDRNQSSLNSSSSSPTPAPIHNNTKSRQKWSKRFTELQRYKSQHGDTNVPPHDTSLGRWVSHQRAQYQKMMEGQSSYMTFDRIAALNELGFTWTVDPPQKREWDARLEELRSYKARHDGSVNVPLDDELFKDLGKWVAQQREEGRKMMEGQATLMTMERIKALDSLGFWGKQRTTNPPYNRASALKGSRTEAAEAEQWDKCLEDLKQYKSHHGHTNVPGKYGPNPYLGRWVALQRQKYHAMTSDRKYHRKRENEAQMTQERVDKLNDLGFEWALKATWQDRFEDLCRYKEEYGNTIVPTYYEPDRALGKWVGKQRTEYYRRQQGRPVSLNEERIQKLNGIGFVWRLQDRQPWEEHLKDLVQYKEQHGDCDVPHIYKPNKTLGQWVSRMRNQYRLMQEGKPAEITSERVAALEKIGFLWRSNRKPPPKSWEDHLQVLLEYKEEHGDCDVPRDYQPNRPLGQWCARMRNQYRLMQEGKRSEITAERVAALEKIGFQWRSSRKPEKSKPRKSKPRTMSC